MLGFTRIDLQVDSTLGLSASLQRYRDPSWRPLRRLMADAEMTVSCVSNVRDVELLLGPHDWHTDPVHAGDTTDKVTFARTRAAEAIALASALGAPYVRFFFGCADRHPHAVVHTRTRPSARVQTASRLFDYP